MIRIQTPSRLDWRNIVVQDGVPFFQTTPPGHTSPVKYWNEGVAYAFTTDEIDRIEQAAIELWDMLHAAGCSIVNSRAFSRLGIPEECWERIEQTWWAEPASVFARFDLSFDPISGGIKLLEINAQTPTTLPEAAVAQWNWLEWQRTNNALLFDADQLNSIHEKLVESWKKQIPHGATIHFACTMPEDAEDEGEDVCNIAYLAETARQAGFQTKIMALDDVHWHDEEKVFHDPELDIITHIFVLYPWEWVFNGNEEFAPHILSTMDIGTPASNMGLHNTQRTTWIEPVYKMLWSNKGILPVLWEMFPGHELLLPCYFDSPNGMVDYVRKPLLSREGANVTIYREGEVIAEQDGIYGEEGFVYQQYVDLVSHSDDSGDVHFPVLGVWMVGDEVAGMGIRESHSLITNNCSRFVPHAILAP